MGSALCGGGLPWHGFWKRGGEQLLPYSKVGDKHIEHLLIFSVVALVIYRLFFVNIHNS